MAKTNNHSESWLISPKGFTSLLGAEYHMLKDAGGKVLQRFYLAAVSIVTICIISMLSIGYAIDLLFHMLWVEIILATFISLLFLIIYVFLINTFTKEKENANPFTFSNITRTGFVVFMAFILSKPIEAWLMKDRIEKQVELYKQKLEAEHEKGLYRLYGSDIVLLQNRVQQLQALAVAPNEAVFASQIANINNRIAVLERKIKDNLALAKLRIEGSDFFIYRVLQVVRSPLSWLICSLITGLFILPGLLIYSMSEDNAYFKLKKDHERAVITAAYHQFCDSYSTLLSSPEGKPILFYSVYEDPPFNTRRRTGPKYKDGNSFFDKYAV